MMAFLVVFASHAGMPEATAGALLVLVSATAMLNQSYRPGDAHSHLSVITSVSPSRVTTRRNRPSSG